MSSILNSISQGDLQVQSVPRDKPIKEDSIAYLLQNSEIEFEIPDKTCDQESSKLPMFEEFEIIQTDDIQKPSLDDLFQNSEISLPVDLPIVDKLDDINTGFGEDHDLHYKIQCLKLNTPLYKENYLNEFTTEEDKAAARHALGLYNKGDVIAMSLLTAEDGLPSKQAWNDATLKQLKKGDKFFTPYTSFSAVFDSNGDSLETKIINLNELINQQQKEITKINEVSNNSSIFSLGDVRVFLQGFNNGDNLKTTLNNMNEEMLRFESTGQI